MTGLKEGIALLVARSDLFTYFRTILLLGDGLVEREGRYVKIINLDNWPRRRHQFGRF